LSIYIITVLFSIEEHAIESVQLRRLLSANIKKYRKKLGISQEKLAGLSGLSIQTINGIEGCRAWVSDNTLTAIAAVLHVEVFQLLLPWTSDEMTERHILETQRLQGLRHSIKTDIDAHFDRFLKPEQPLDTE
jgi:transcriptional regulator with XRE-family HTH domain